MTAKNPSNYYESIPDKEAHSSVTISFRIEAIAKAKLMCISEREGIKLSNLYREIIYFYLRDQSGEIDETRLTKNLKKILREGGGKEE